MRRSSAAGASGCIEGLGRNTSLLAHAGVGGLVPLKG